MVFSDFILYVLYLSVIFFISFFNLLMTMFNLFISFSLFLLNSSVLLLLFIILFFNKRILSSFSFNKLFLPLIISSNSVNLLLLFNNSNSISFTNINSDIYLFPLLFFLLLSSLSHFLFYLNIL